VFEDVQVIQNPGTERLKLWVEPWAAEYDLPAGEALTIVGQSEQDGQFEIAKYDRGVAAYGWAGASITVRKGDNVIDELPVWSHDWVPSGGSIRGLVETLGGPDGHSSNSKPQDPTSQSRLLPRLFRFFGLHCHLA
jgi:hypothetical protein